MVYLGQQFSQTRQPSRDSRFAVRPVTLPLDRILVSIHLALSVVGRALDQIAKLAGVTEQS